MKSGEINAASVACYIASLERENEWLRDRNMEMIDISAVRGIPVGISDDLVKRRIGDRRTVRDYVNKRMFTVHPEARTERCFWTCLMCLQRLINRCYGNRLGV